VLSIIAVALATSLAACSSHSGSPTQPSPGVSVTGVSFGGTSIAVGGTAQGIVRLSEPAPAAGVVVTLASSNTSVITVPESVTVPAGTDTATFTATGVSAGSATVRATLNGATVQSSPLNASSTVAILSITPSAGSVVGGDPLPVAIALTGPAPAGGAAIAISATDPVDAPSSVTIPQGQASQNVTILTRAVGGDISATITASYGGGSASATIKVTRPTTARANFGVTGPSQSETCTLAADGQTVNCTFDGSTSSAPGKITAWEWTYGVSTSRTQTTTTPIFSSPPFDCSMLPAPPLPSGTGWFAMVVKLKVRDELGNVSEAASHGDVRLLPQGACGY
jgi:hypothetical protein